MPKGLEQVQLRVGKKYLGKAGIHGFGLRYHGQLPGVLVVYIDPNESTGRTRVLAQLRRDARPYKVEEINMELATAAQA